MDSEVIHIAEVDWPRCARCVQLPVHTFVAIPDELNDCTIMVAECHGETETVIVPNKILREADTIKIGLAFAEGDST